ncbi:AAA family ATPase [Candidatus Dojkabacteria bacterium]|nr:AAA family ATPase [Candidatus Dojkabacteria bacterium]
MIKRTIYPQLKKHLDSGKITLITGPRQSGKTTLMKMLMFELEKKDKQFVYLNLDIENDFRVLKTQESLKNYLGLELGTSEKTYVFIDEIQRKINAGVFLKGLYDQSLPYKFIVSGSGSVELKEKVSEGLSGRKKTFKLSTVSFLEFINYMTDYKYEDNLEDYLRSDFFDTNLLHRYLQFGGYPEIVTTEIRDEKIDIIESIYESFVDKDIKQLLDIRNSNAFIDILAFLSTRIGQLTDRSSISNAVNISYDTTREYIYYLEKTFILDIVRPYSTNPETEISKTPVYYFIDLGMRNFVFNKMSNYNPLVSGSMLFQNLVYGLLKEKYPSEIKYWRTKDQAEVDFVIDHGGDVVPVEVKFSNLEKLSIGKSLHSFINKYKPKECFVVNLSMRAERKVKETVIRFVPYWELIS